MKIGVCKKDLPGLLIDNLKWLSENKFDGFQIWPDKIKNPDELLLICKNMGLVISAIGGGPNLINPETMHESIDSYKKRMDKKGNKYRDNRNR